MNGYIKLHRQITEWEWYRDPNTLLVFIDILLRANIKDCKYRGRTIEKGHLLTTVERIACNLGLSKDEVRTAIKHLKSSHTISTTKYMNQTLIKVHNYAIYQGQKDKNSPTVLTQPPTQIPNGSRTVPAPNEGEGKEVIYIVEYLNEKTGKEFRTTTKDTIRHIHARLNEGYTRSDFIRVIDTKVSQWRDDPERCIYLRPSTLFGNKFEAYLNENKGGGNSDPYGGMPLI